MILASFSVQKMYGRQPENIEIINQVFHTILAKFDAKKVIMAFETWMERSNDFPTPADIVGLIQRNGKPPITQAMYISASKKDYEDRSEEEKKLMREYEAQHHESGWNEGGEPKKKSDMEEENIRLRGELAKARIEIKRLSDVLHNERKQRGIEPENKKTQNKIEATIQHMRATGASQADIEAFQRGSVFA